VEKGLRSASQTQDALPSRSDRAGKAKGQTTTM